MPEHNRGEDHLSPIETYLQSIEVNESTVRDGGVQRELVGGTQDDVISADTVRAPKRNSKTQIQATPQKSNQQRSNTPRTPPRRIKNTPIPERSQDKSSVFHCDYCWKKGHLVADCYKYLDICNFCKTKEHTKSDCWSNNENHPTKGRISIIMGMIHWNRKIGISLKTAIVRYLCQADVDPLIVSVALDHPECSQYLDCMIDTGAGVSLVNAGVLHTLKNLELKLASDVNVTALKGFGGTAKIPVEHNNERKIVFENGFVTPQPIMLFVVPLIL
ncbi:hypothetical protein Avbf_14860 [Armadillidium vulgare]|nr:hypothetical protein Avbf_14860 [Armadillidium vulgare]